MIRFQISDNSDPRQLLAEFSPQTKDMWTYGAVAVEEGLTAKRVEVVKSERDPSSGLPQGPTIKIKEIQPIAPETNAKLLNLTRSSITPLPGTSLQEYGGAVISGGLAVRVGGNLNVDKTRNNAQWKRRNYYRQSHISQTDAVKFWGPGLHVSPKM